MSVGLYLLPVGNGRSLPRTSPSTGTDKRGCCRIGRHRGVFPLAALTLSPRLAGRGVKPHRWLVDYPAPIFHQFYLVPHLARQNDLSLGIRDCWVLLPAPSISHPSKRLLRVFYSLKISFHPMTGTFSYR